MRDSKSLATRSAAPLICDRKMFGKRPMTKISIASGAREMSSRAVTSGKRLFSLWVTGPKNIFCTTISM